MKKVSKIHFGVIVILTLFTSCQLEDENNLNNLSSSNIKKDISLSKRNSLDKVVSMKNLNGIKNRIKLEFKNSNNEFSPSEVELDNFKSKYSKNVEFMKTHNLKELFIENNINPEIITVLDFYEENSDNKNVNQEILNKFSLTNQDAETFLGIIEMKNYIEKEIADGISWGCALAIAGTVGATAGFIGVTGGWALVGAAGLKVLATAALVEACGDGWGEVGGDGPPQTHDQKTIIELNGLYPEDELKELEEGVLPLKYFNQ